MRGPGLRGLYLLGTCARTTATPPLTLIRSSIMHLKILGSCIGAAIIAFSLDVSRASEPTLDETVKYLDEKLTTQRMEDYKLQGVELTGSIFTLYYRTYSNSNPFNPAYYDNAVRINFKRVKDMDSKDRVDFIKNNSFTLYCDNSDSLCAERRLCNAEKQCDSWEKISSFDVPYYYMSDSDKERIKKAYLHLKTFFPFERKKELFDNN